MKTKSICVDLSIYIVEEDQTVLSYVKSIVESAHTVSTFSNPLKFLKNYKHDPLNLIICATEFSGLHGDELIKKVHNSFGMVPVIFITDSKDYKLFTALVENGAVGALAKPFSKEELIYYVTCAAKYVYQRSIGEISYKSLLRHFGELRDYYVSIQKEDKLIELEQEIQGFYKIKQLI